MFHKPKPETVARAAAGHRKRRIEQSANLTERLREAAERHGPDSIYAEMLAERLANA